MTERKFYKRFYTVAVLSEGCPYQDYGLMDIAEAIDSGECAGTYWHDHTEELNGRQVVSELESMGRSSNFFQLDNYGNDWDFHMELTEAMKESDHNTVQIINYSEGEWQALLFNNKIVYENHRVNITDVIRHTNNEPFVILDQINYEANDLDGWYEFIAKWEKA